MKQITFLALLFTAISQLQASDDATGVGLQNAQELEEEEEEKRNQAVALDVVLTDNAAANSIPNRICSGCNTTKKLLFLDPQTKLCFGCHDKAKINAKK
jgi:hypothetical protein